MSTQWLHTGDCTALPRAERNRAVAPRSVRANLTLPFCLVQGLGCEDALTHLLNYVWPNIFETSPHVVNAVTGAIDGCRLALGPAVVMSYTLQVRRTNRSLRACAATSSDAPLGRQCSTLLACHIR